MRKLKINIKVPSPSRHGLHGSVLHPDYLYREKRLFKQNGYRYQEIVRNIAVVELLFGTGIRVSNCSALRP
ncbi:MAG: hypothetical protein ACLT8E_06490 [Akkermansia sp.]